LRKLVHPAFDKIWFAPFFEFNLGRGGEVRANRQQLPQPVARQFQLTELP